MVGTPGCAYIPRNEGFPAVAATSDLMSPGYFAGQPCLHCAFCASHCLRHCCRYSPLSWPPLTCLLHLAARPSSFDIVDDTTHAPARFRAGTAVIGRAAGHDAQRAVATVHGEGTPPAFGGEEPGAVHPSGVLAGAASICQVEGVLTVRGARALTTARVRLDARLRSVAACRRFRRAAVVTLTAGAVAGAVANDLDDGLETRTENNQEEREVTGHGFDGFPHFCVPAKPGGEERLVADSALKWKRTRGRRTTGTRGRWSH